jgi:hypothetical protein
MAFPYYSKVRVSSRSLHQTDQHTPPKARLTLCLRTFWGLVKKVTLIQNGYHERGRDSITRIAACTAPGPFLHSAFCSTKVRQTQPNYCASPTESSTQFTNWTGGGEWKVLRRLFNCPEIPVSFLRGGSRPCYAGHVSIMTSFWEFPDRLFALTRWSYYLLNKMLNPPRP